MNCSAEEVKTPNSGSRELLSNNPYDDIKNQKYVPKTCLAASS